MMIKYKENLSNKFQIFASNFNDNKTCKITGLIMVKNQENNIIHALNSLSKVCDHIVVVDTGSTDNTVSNVKKFSNVELHELKWHDNYSEMRNKTLQYVTAGWVLVLDSDEILTQKCTYAELHRFLCKLETNKKSDNIICTMKCRSKGESAFVRKRNLFKISPTLKYHGLVHEELITIGDSTNEIIDTNLEIINKGTSIKEINKFDKLNRYSRLLLKQIKLEPNNPRWTAMISPEYICKDLISKDKYKLHLQKFIFKRKIDDFSVSNIKRLPYLKYNLARYLIILGIENNYDLAIKGCKLGERIYPYDINFLSMDTMFENEKSNITSLKSLKTVVEKLKNAVIIWN